MKTNGTSARSRHAAATLIVLVGLTGCSSGRHDTIGFKKTSLDLTFKQPRTTPVLTPLVRPVVVSAVPYVPVDRGTPVPVLQSPPPPPPPPVSPCPAAPADAVPDYRPSQLVVHPPTPGTYLRKANGTIVITSGGKKTTIQMPPYITWVIKDVKPTEPDPSAQIRATTSSVPIKPMEFTVVKNILPGYYSEALTLYYDDTAVKVKQRSVTAFGKTATFIPKLPHTLLQLVDSSGKGEDRMGPWVDSGTDPSSNQTATIRGQYGTGADGLDRRERVDVCGKLYEGWRAAITEVDTSGNPAAISTTSMKAGSASTDSDNTMVVVPQNGVAVVKEHQHYTVTVPSPGGSADTVVWDYTTTAMSINPVPDKYLGLLP